MGRKTVLYTVWHGAHVTTCKFVICKNTLLKIGKFISILKGKQELSKIFGLTGSTLNFIIINSTLNIFNLSNLP